MRASIVRGRFCYSRVDAGVSSQTKVGSNRPPLFTVVPFIALVKQEPIGASWEEQCFCSVRPSVRSKSNVGGGS